MLSPSPGCWPDFILKCWTSPSPWSPASSWPKTSEVFRAVIGGYVANRQTASFWSYLLWSILSFLFEGRDVQQMDEKWKEAYLSHFMQIEYHKLLIYFKSVTTVHVFCLLAREQNGRVTLNNRPLYEVWYAVMIDLRIDPVEGYAARF